MKIEKEKVKNFLINRTFLVKKASSIHDVLDFLTCIQVDPINVVARTHELSLYNRVENFKIKDLYSELYEKKTLFEYWLQLYSIIPSKYFPYFKASMETKDTWHSEYYLKHKKEIDLTLEYITKNGATSSLDLSHIEKVGNVFSWNNSSRTGALEYLWDKGVVMVSKRVSNRKFYDLTTRIIGNSLEKVTEEESLKFLVEASFHYLGIVSSPYLVRSGRSLKPALRQEFKKLLKKGGIVKLEIEGIKRPYYILKKDIPALLNAKRLHTGINILPPLDPLIIDREILNDIFGFFYRWEAYTPQSKRLFGYYGMPVLYKGEIVGQIELVKDSKKKLKIKNLKVNVKTTEFKKLLDSEVQKIEKLIRLNLTYNLGGNYL